MTFVKIRSHEMFETKVMRWPSLRVTPDPDPAAHVGAQFVHLSERPLRRVC
jgi:hypothetical protein